MLPYALESQAAACRLEAPPPDPWRQHRVSVRPETTIAEGGEIALAESPDLKAVVSHHARWGFRE